MSRVSSVVSFLHELGFADLPDVVVEQAQRCLTDLLGVGAAGSSTALSRIVRDHAVRHFGAGTGGGARMLFDGRRVSPVGAALAGGMTIDSVDAHDGHALTKGHAGAAVLPSLLAYLDSGIPVRGHELLTVLVVGYEIGIRAGMSLHAAATDYHSSGAWNALACAAVGARLLGLDRQATSHALGIAEYHAPRSPMMRCIDHPTMVKDGSGWGAMTGTDAAYLAADGFTGAPAQLLEPTGEGDDVWADLGARWRIREQYFKPYPVCRWTHPAIDAVLALRRRLGPPYSTLVERIEVDTFSQAVRLVTRRPTTTEQAQYSLPFCVAAALARGRLGVDEIDGAALADPEIAHLSMSAIVRERADYSARFPAQRCAEVTLVLRDGQRVLAEAASAKGDPTDPLSDAELADKYRSLTEPIVGRRRSVQILGDARALASADTTAASLLNTVLAAPAQGQRQQ
ncbi:MAG: MmgE/PrpD family protein [Actinomycetota bacterium]|nr:MmgE/PrpD family protein [Actinomycetota bacterium]